jgi:signal transduction histidine kinase
MLRPLKIWLSAALGLLCAQAAGSLVLHRGFLLIALSDLTQLLLLLSGMIAMFVVASASRGRARLFWGFMGLGMAFWLAYQVLWCMYEIVLRRDVPNPFMGDAVLFLHIVPMIAALAAQPDVEHDYRTTRLGALDFSMLVVWWLYLYLVTVIPWQSVHRALPQYDHNLNILYLIEKVALLSGLVWLCLQSKGTWRSIYANWFCCTLLYSFTSFLANWAIERKLYFSGSIYDVPLAASMAWVTWIGLTALSSVSRQAPERVARAHSVWAARLGMITVFSLPLFVAWTVFNSSAPPKVRTFRLVVTLAAMLLLGILVFVKQHVLDGELLELLKTSEASFENLTRLQAQLVQSEKLASLGQLVGGAAHELNNPLTAMLGYSELLAATPLTTEQHSLMQKIEQQVRRTRTLVSSLLSFAKQVPAEKTLLDINSLVQTAVKLYPPQLRTANLQVHTNLATNLPRILGDSNQLLQVCLHVTNNALHAMEEKGGVLNVATRLEGSMIVIEFSDNGPGMSDPERVFDPFYTTRPVGQGTGLGLSVCYGIIQEHSGHISCRNRPGGGATFRIELPVIREGALISRGGAAFMPSAAAAKVAASPR